MNVCIIIPAYNESTAIGSIIQQVRRQNREVIVIDDGSTDTTNQISKNCGAVVLKNTKNQGKGFSIIRGLRYILDKDFDAAITMDGDGQHCPEDISLFIQRAQITDAGIIIGNRIHEPRRMPFIRILTNKFMSWLISRLIKQKIPDTQCGFRLIKRELLEKIKLTPLERPNNQKVKVRSLMEFTTRRFETESEILFQASHLGYKIESISIKTIYRREKSRINPIVDTIRFVNFIWRQIWTTQP